MITHPFHALTHEPDTTLTPQTLIGELTELYLRVNAEPVSDDPATETWRGYTVLLSATLAATLGRLTHLAPRLATDIAAWWDWQSEDPGLSDFYEWAEQTVGVEQFRAWEANGRQAAAKSAARTAA